MDSAAGMVGTTISHYEVLEKLGEGGMGMVYKAKDIQLGRFVAVKVLLPTGENTDRRARFLQEARAASALNHPNIITIHDILTVTAGDCIVMEFIRGHTLADAIEASRIPVVDALKYAMQVADALNAAHGIGIVHRDLKPANVMVTPESLAKVLDFGLAKLAGERSPMDLGESDATVSISGGMGAQPKTTEGAIIGTLSYMSPEQARGEQVDHRSDIFSFGSVFYEMLTQQKAFHGKTGLETLAAILRDEPRPFPKDLVVPDDVRDVAMRCLRKDPDQRYQSMGDVKAALEQLYFASRSGIMQAQSGIWKRPAARAVPTIAVLPFLNLSSDKENEYFSDGLAEEIINALTRLPNLRVTARTSAFAFKGAQEDVRRIGETLNVASVLEGSVRKAGNRVRISVQLIGVDEGNNIWSERFDREMTDVFEIQDEISHAIVENLKVRLAAESTDNAAAVAAPIIKRYTDNLEAYDLYLRGRYELYKMTREGLDASKRLFEEAIRLDPKYAPAHDGLAYCWYSEGFLGFIAPTEAMPKAKAAVRRAIALDDSLAEAHGTLGVILALYDWDWAGAEREMMRSIELNNASPGARDVYAFYYLRPVGRIAEAITEVQNALALDPLSILFRVHLGFLYYVERSYDHSIAQFRKVVDMNPAYYLAHAMMAFVYIQRGQFEEARACYTRARAADVSSKFVDSIEAMALAGSGQRDQARAMAAAISQRSSQEYISPVSIAYVHTALGDFDAAFAHLDRAVHDRDPNILGMKSNPIFDPIRDDPRYHALLAKMQLA
jgi:serine/threonine-protein kinase